MFPVSREIEWYGNFNLTSKEDRSLSLMETAWFNIFRARFQALRANPVKFFWGKWIAYSVVFLVVETKLDLL